MSYILTLYFFHPLNIIPTILLRMFHIILHSTYVSCIFARTNLLRLREHRAKIFKLLRKAKLTVKYSLPLSRDKSTNLNIHGSTFKTFFWTGQN